jgi:hypothetical protein
LLTSLNFSNTTRSSSNIAGFAEFAEMWQCWITNVTSTKQLRRNLSILFGMVNVKLFYWMCFSHSWKLVFVDFYEQQSGMIYAGLSTLWNSLRHEHSWSLCNIEIMLIRLQWQGLQHSCVSNVTFDFAECHWICWNVSKVIAGIDKRHS